MFLFKILTILEFIQWNLAKLRPEGIQISEMFGIVKCIWF